MPHPVSATLNFTTTEAPGETKTGAPAVASVSPPRPSLPCPLSPEVSTSSSPIADSLAIKEVVRKDEPNESDKGDDSERNKREEVRDEARIGVCSCDDDFRKEPQGIGEKV